MLYDRLHKELDQLRSSGLFKQERALASAQHAQIRVGSAEPRPLVNMCANNYLGFANDPRLIKVAKDALDSHGLGVASVRFICGTQDIHLQLEAELSEFLGTEDTILFASCFDANGAVFEPLFGPEDAIISDALNHASIIDGIRLSKARRYRFKNRDLTSLEANLRQADAESARNVIVVTDGVFSMDGTFAPLKEMRALCDHFGAQLMVDDCHATGFIGSQGRGTHERAGIIPDIITGTFGKALGGSIGGYVSGKKVLIERLRQSARPYLFSNSLPPAVVATARAALTLALDGNELREDLSAKTKWWRKGLSRLGFDVPSGSHPITPVMLGDAILTQQMASRLDDLGVYVAGFTFPVVPKGTDRLRTQISVAHTMEDLAFALDAFATAGRELRVI
jgi:glycine C-acetyltransferase